MIQRVDSEFQVIRAIDVVWSNLKNNQLIYIVMKIGYNELNYLNTRLQRTLGYKEHLVIENTRL